MKDFLFESPFLLLAFVNSEEQESKQCYYLSFYAVINKCNSVEVSEDMGDCIKIAATLTKQ